MLFHPDLESLSPSLPILWPQTDEEERRDVEALEQTTRWQGAVQPSYKVLFASLHSVLICF
jgi:hypothetical protein